MRYKLDIRGETVMTSVIATNGSSAPINLKTAAAIGLTGVQHAAASETSVHADRSLIIIDGRALDRECLAQSITAHRVGMQVLAFGSVEEWKHKQDDYPPLAAILLNVGGRKIADPNVSEEIRKLATEFGTTPVIVLADTDELSQIMKALELGARGY
ncbi:DNA-binding response regulator, partial [Rhizobiaceae sp. 2RAB30]